MECQPRVGGQAFVDRDRLAGLGPEGLVVGRGRHGGRHGNNVAVHSLDAKRPEEAALVGHVGLVEHVDFRTGVECEFFDVFNRDRARSGIAGGRERCGGPGPAAPFVDAVPDSLPAGLVLLECSQRFQIRRLIESAACDRNKAIAFLGNRRLVIRDDRPPGPFPLGDHARQEREAEGHQQHEHAGYDGARVPALPADHKRGDARQEDDRNQDQQNHLHTAQTSAPQRPAGGRAGWPSTAPAATKPDYKPAPGPFDEVCFESPARRS